MNLEIVRVVFWGIALLIMANAVRHALRGVRLARQGEIELHQRAMNRAATWVLVFLATYALKVATLGHESLDTWTPNRRLVLDVHRSFVFTMLIAGTAGRLLAGSARRRAGWPRRVHRVLGWITLPTAVLGLVTASVVFAQMVGSLR